MAYTLTLAIKDEVGGSATMQVGSRAYTATPNNPVSVSINSGTSVTLTASPASGKVFQQWSFIQGYVSNDNPYTFTFTGQFDTLWAVFGNTTTYNLTLGIYNDTGGTAEMSVGGRVYTARPGSPVIATGITPGSSIMFTGMAYSGKRFLRWRWPQGQISTTNPWSTTVENWDVVNAEFEDIPTYTITASAGSGGTISPSGNVSIQEYDGMSFYVTADNYYQIYRLRVDGARVYAAEGTTSYRYQFTNVTEDHTIQATFLYSPPTYTITATAGTGGSISPSGSVTVNEGDSQTFTVRANTGYEINKIKVDGSSIPL